MGNRVRYAHEWAVAAMNRALLSVMVGKEGAVGSRRL
jgi:hypothetical protein